MVRKTGIPALSVGDHEALTGQIGGKSIARFPAGVGAHVRAHVLFLPLPSLDGLARNVVAQYCLSLGICHPPVDTAKDSSRSLPPAAAFPFAHSSARLGVLPGPCECFACSSAEALTRISAAYSA